MFLLLLAVVLLLKCVLYVYENKKILQFHFKLKNDIKSYPILGHAYLFIGSNEHIMNSMNRLGQEATRQGGMISIRVLEKVYGVVSDAEIAEIILKTSLDKIDVMTLAKNFIGNGTLIAPVSIWRLRRKVLVRWLVSKNVRQFVDTFDRNSRIMADMLEDKAGQGAFSIWKYLSAYALDTICESAVDVKLNALQNPNQPFIHAFEKYCQKFSKRIFYPFLYNDTIYSSLPWFWDVSKHINTMHRTVEQIIKRKEKDTVFKEEDMDDAYSNTRQGVELKSLLHHLRKPLINGKRYSDMELREEVLMTLLGGTDTSATGEGLVLLMMAAHQDEQEIVYKELHDIFGSTTRPVTPDDLRETKYLDAFIKETLRLYPPVPIIGRRIGTDTTIPSGLVIPAGMQVVVSLWAIMRNPRYWGEDALQFRPSRFSSGEPLPSGALVPFSIGPRNCTGFQYAMTSMKTLIINVLRRYKVLHAQEFEKGQSPPPLRLKFEIMVKDAENFNLRLGKRIAREDNL